MDLGQVAQGPRCRPVVTATLDPLRQSCGHAMSRWIEEQVGRKLRQAT
jgi:hypothetical protein